MAARGSGVTLDDASSTTGSIVNAANYFASNGMILKIDGAILQGTKWIEQSRAGG